MHPFNICKWKNIFLTTYFHEQSLGLPSLFHYSYWKEICLCVCLHKCVWLGAGETEREELGEEVKNMYFK